MRPVSVFIDYVERDADFVQELEKHLSSLVAAGQINLLQVHPGEEFPIEESTLCLPVLSADYLASDQAKLLHTRWTIPILYRPCVLGGTIFERFTGLPTGGRFVTTWANRDEALVDVVLALRRITQEIAEAPPYAVWGEAFRTMRPRGAVRRMADWLSTLFEKPTLHAGKPIPIASIFRISSPPDITFVEPSQMPRLQDLLLNMGPGLVVEGPSGVGKTTAVKKALDATQPQLWLRSSTPEDLARLDRALAGEIEGHLVVDDFHRLDEERKRRLASRMKAVADDERHAAKITVIGINPVGYSLTDGLPDLAGRFQIIAMDRQPDDKIRELIQKGEQAANIRFTRREEFINEADGSFFTAQRLCYEAARAAGVKETQPRLTDVTVGPLDVLDTIRDELRFKYQAALRTFASYDQAPPPRGACLILLWLLSRSPNGHVSLEEARLRYPQVTDALAWLRQSNLGACFEKTPELKSLVHYNRAAAILSIEDPQLKFYLRRMPWVEFAEETGHRGVRLHPSDGLLLPVTSGPRPAPASPSAAPAIGPAQAEPEEAIRVLHLSDLHFGTQDMATISYAQLAEDLREQGCDRLDAVIVSGDITSFSRTEEYVAARIFLMQILDGFGLSADRLVLVPGNHDLSWDLSQESYSLIKRRRYHQPLEEGRYISHGPDVIEVRDEEAYRRRFTSFAQFYRELKGEEYPLAYEDQATLHDLKSQGLLILGLNSAWEIDHHYKARAGIHPGALARALNRLRERPAPDLVGIAVWHHPLHSAEPDHIKDTSFVQQLAKAGFRVALHGHIHRADNQLYRYDQSPEGRRIEIIGAGTFGAPTSQWVPGYPLQYNLLKFTPGRLTVETRCREEVNGAWRPDARWLKGPGQDPEPRYHVPLPR